MDLLGILGVSKLITLLLESINVDTSMQSIVVVCVKRHAKSLKKIGTSSAIENSQKITLAKNATRSVVNLVCQLHAVVVVRINKSNCIIGYLNT